MSEPFAIVYEDNHLLVVLKAPNVLSQGDASGDPDMVTLLKAYTKEKHQKPGEVYLGLVHRLDRPVGGLMVFARTSKAAARLSAQLREHEIGREYLCVCQGEIDSPFTLTDFLLKDEKNNMVSVVPQGGQKAILHGEPVKVKDGLTLCKIRLETGRSHQIRVQMLHFGHPLWGDNRYGSGKPGQQIALWGYKLSLIHPTRKETMVFYQYPKEGGFAPFMEELNAKTLSI